MLANNVALDTWSMAWCKVATVGLFVKYIRLEPSALHLMAQVDHKENLLLSFTGVRWRVTVVIDQVRPADFKNMGSVLIFWGECCEPSNPNISFQSVLTRFSPVHCLQVCALIVCTYNNMYMQSSFAFQFNFLPFEGDTALLILWLSLDTLYK